VRGVAFDAGGLIALDCNGRRVLTLIARANAAFRSRFRRPHSRKPFVTPPGRCGCQRFIRQVGTKLMALDGPDASAVGLLLARTGTSDVVDAHVAVCARRAGQAIVTSDTADFRRIAPDVPLVVL
jgi:hypothetical protein